MICSELAAAPPSNEPAIWQLPHRKTGRSREGATKGTEARRGVGGRGDEEYKIELLQRKFVLLHDYLATLPAQVER